MPSVKQDETEADVNPVPWSEEQVKAWRLKNPSVSPWKVVRIQLLTGLVLVIAVGMFAGYGAAMQSIAYGVGCVIVPASMFVRGLRLADINRFAQQGMVRFMVWELAKIALTVAMLGLAPKLIVDLNWLALLAGFVVTMKMQWVAVWLHPVKNKSLLDHL